MSKVFYFLFLSFWVFPYSWAATYKFLPASGFVRFSAIGKPSFIKIKGKGEGVIGQLVESEGVISGGLDFNLKSLSTEVELRDEHMLNKYLDVNRFPQAQLKILSLKLADVRAEGFPFEGELTIKGETKIVKGTARVEEGTNGTRVRAEFLISLNDYKAIGVPSFGGVTVADRITVEIEVSAQKEN